MILLNEDWTFTAADEECDIGYAGENGVRTLDIQMSGLEYAGWDFFLDVQRKGQKDIWAVEPEALDGDLLLRIPIRRAYLIEDGPVYAQLRASAPDGRIKKSAQLMLHVKCSINSVESAPSPLPSEFAAYEARMVAIRDAVEELFGRSAVPYEIVDFCEGWAFSKDQSSWETVNIPHTCNVSDGMSGSMYRGKAYYRKDLFVSREDAAIDFVLVFCAAGQSSEIYVNGRFCDAYPGGYTPNIVDISPYLSQGSNEILIVCDNSPSEDVIPVSGDFNLNNGLHEKVYLCRVGRVSFDPQAYGMDRMHVTQNNISEQAAAFTVETAVNNRSGCSVQAAVTFTVCDTEGATVAEETVLAEIPAHTLQVVSYDGQIANPHLWDGIEDPYRYVVKAELAAPDKVDEQSVRIGFRYFSINAQQGFLLNGRPYPLRGVALHQDYPGAMSAMTQEQFHADYADIAELGCNFVRLAHYPHDAYAFEQCDALGLVVQTEIPWVNHLGPDASEAYHNSIEQNLRSMIRNYYNHPSIVFWGLSNELNCTHWNSGGIPQGGFSSEMAVAWNNEFYALAKMLDPTRYVGFTAYGPTFDGSDPDDWQADFIASNEYKGWYGGTFNQFGTQMDAYRTGTQKFWAVGEYGAGNNPNTHSDNPMETTETGSGGARHDEEYANLFHEAYLAQIQERPWLVYTAAWLLYDFAVSNRNEGGTPFLNDKGLITRDRQTKKDIYYLYQAAWSDQPVCYITSRRFRLRETATIKIKVYSNCEQLTLSRDGEPVQTLYAPVKCGCVWEFDPVAFVNASEVYTVTGIRGEEVLSDTVTFLTSAISGQILPESIAADVSKLDLQVGQAKEVHVSYVPNTANVELDYTAALTGLAGSAVPSGATVTVTASEAGSGTLNLALDWNGASVSIPVTAEETPEYLCYFDFTTGSNDDPSVEDSTGNATCTMEGFAWDETSGFTENGLKTTASGSSTEMVTISGFDLSECTNGFRMHMEYAGFASTWDRSRFFQLVDNEGTVILDCYYNSPTAAQLRIERDSNNGGLYNDYEYMLNMTHMTMDITCNNVATAAFDGAVSNDNGNIVLSDVLVAKQGGSATDTPFDMLALKPFQDVSKIYLMNRLDKTRLLHATLSKFWIEKL